MKIFLWRPRGCPRRFLLFAIPSGRFKALSTLRISRTTHAANAERGESICQGPFGRRLKVINHARQISRL